MKIVYLAQHFLPEIGALPARISEMVPRWKAAGAEVTIVTGMPHRPEGRIHAGYRGKLFLQEDWDGIRVLRSWLYASPSHGFAATIANNLSFMATGVLSALRAERPDVLIASAPPFFVHPAGDLIARLRRTPLVLELRDLWPDYLAEMGIVKGRASTAALFGLERYLLMRAARVVVVTESFRQRVRSKGVLADRIDVIPNGVDTTQYVRAPEAPPLTALERQSGEFLVGYLGNFGAGQALETVLEAAAILASTHPTVRFVLAGDGTQKRDVVRLADELGLPNLSIHPSIAKERTRAFYNACDVCLVPLAPLPILEETVPSKIFEVLACERPVLANVAGEAAEIVTASGGGIVAPPGSGGAMAAAIGRLAEMPHAQRREMGRRGREFVARRYSRVVLADRYLEMLTALVSRVGGPLAATCPAASDANRPGLPD